MGKLILLLPDPSIPYVQPSLPRKLEETLIPGRLDKIVVFGKSCLASNLKTTLLRVCNSVNFLSDFSSDNTDGTKRTPSSMIEEVQGIKIGFFTSKEMCCPSFNTAELLRRRKNLDILAYTGGVETGVNKNIISLGELKNTEGTFCVLYLESSENCKKATVYKYKMDGEQLDVNNDVINI